MLDIFASLESFGRSPVSRDCCSIICNIGVIGSAHSLRIWFGIVSGPEALLGLTCLNSFSRPFCSILIGVMSVFAWILVFGRVLSVVLVKTDLNWSNRSSAFPLLSLIKFDPFFKDAIPPASCRFDFICFQNGLVLLFFSPSKMFWLIYSYSAFRRCLAFFLVWPVVGPFLRFPSLSV